MSLRWSRMWPYGPNSGEVETLEPALDDGMYVMFAAGLGGATENNVVYVKSEKLVRHLGEKYGFALQMVGQFGGPEYVGIGNIQGWAE